MLREGLVSLLHGSDFKVISAVPTLDDVPQLALERASLLMIGASSQPSEVLDYLKKTSSSARKVKIAIIAEVSDKISQPDVLKFLCHGADCCIFNVRSRDILLKSLHLAALGQRIVVMGQDSVSLDSFAVEHKPNGLGEYRPIIEYKPRINGEFTAQLSARELEILRLVVAGDSNKVIARTCHLAESTVKIHLKTILRKIRVRNRTQAAIWAIQNAHGGEAA